MLRLVVDDEGQIWPDLLQKAPGRGTYLCMQQVCLEGLTDKRLGALRNRFNVQLPQSLSLMERIGEGLRRQLMRLFSQFGAVAVLGRDAVMHQMWKSGPLLVMLASDAGDALAQQVEDGVGKRQGAGEKTVCPPTAGPRPAGWRHGPHMRRPDWSGSRRRQRRQRPARGWPPRRC
jgi:predicted RNA-binding protein YlxR (DUF448 family)